MLRKNVGGSDRQAQILLSQPLGVKSHNALFPRQGGLALSYPPIASQ